MKPIRFVGLLVLLGACVMRPRHAYKPPPDTPTVAAPTAFAAQDQRRAAPRISDNPAEWQRKAAAGAPGSAFWQPLHQAPAPAGTVIYRTITKPAPWWGYLAVAAAGITVGACAHRYLPGLILRLPLS